VVLELDSGREHLFSARYACPVCDYSLSELEPRLFSFNNPMGACPECDGLARSLSSIPARVAHASLSLASGAIKGWDRRNQFYFQMLTSLAAHFGFDVEAPFENLPEPVQTLVLHGTREKIPFSYLSERGRTVVKEHAFEGILPSSSVATRKRTRSWCARSSRNTVTPRPAPRARERGFAWRRATSGSASAPFTR